MSIRMRLTLWYTTLFSLVLVVLAALVYGVVSRQLESQLDYAIHLQAIDAAQPAQTIALGQHTTPLSRQSLPTTTLIDQQFYVQLVDLDGTVLAASTNLAQPLPTPQASLQSALVGQEDHRTLRVRNERVDMYSAPLLFDGAFVGLLQVAAPLQSLETNLAQLRLVLSGIVLFAVAITAAIGWFVATKAMRPVDLMTRTAHTIGSSTNFAQRLPEPHQHDELGRLATTFNAMLDQLEHAFTTQRQFLADASHELRTPLTTMRMNIETLLHIPDPAAHQDLLQVTARETDRMGRLVADLLALARADAGQPLNLQPLALDTLVLDVYQQAKRSAQHVRLRLGDFEQVAITGDADRLKQLALNLVDNAVRYTPPGGTVALDLVQHNGWALLRVCDTGIGIPAEHLPRIFDRFYRVDQPRSRAVGGTGLGLAICRWIAEAHGGRIDVASQEGVGSTFTVWLPARQ